jgi:hypothetical protein
MIIEFVDRTGKRCSFDSRKVMFTCEMGDDSTFVVMEGNFQFNIPNTHAYQSLTEDLKENLRSHLRRNS